MKYYWWVLPLAVCVPQAWGADAGRVPYHVETVAGSSRIGDGGPPLAAQFSNIQGIAYDRLGNLYLSDTDNHRVRKVSGGIIATIAGTGVAGFSGDGGSALNAQLNLPYGLALDSAGNVYVADLGNQRVRRITPDGIITTVAGTGRKASSPDGAAPTDTSLLSPRNVAVDAAGNLYIAEFEGHRVRKLTPDGKLSTVAGTGVAGSSGDGSRASAAQIDYPAGMAFDRAGGLYFADSGNNAVRKLYADGTIGTVLGRNPDTTLFSPLAVAVDPAGTLYVGDSTFVVRAYTTAGKWIGYAGNGVPSFSGDGGPAASAALTSVNDLAADLNGNLFIADAVRLRRVDPLGIIVTVAGDGYLHSVGDGGPATSAQLFQPSALALDSAGNLFIADSGTQRIRQVLHDGTMTTLAGTGTAARGAADGSPAASVALNTPMGVAMDSSGNVLVADTYNHRVLLVTPAHAIRSVAGTGTGGASPEGTPPLVAQLRGPRAVCADRTGTLYIVDTSNHRVLRLSPGGTLQTAAGNGSKGIAGDGGAARFAQLNTPSACALDSAGNLFIADTANHAIRKVSPAGVISTVAGIFDAGATGDEGAATAARLSSPRGVVVDDTGDIFIGDTGNHRIRQVTPDGVIHTIAGTGTPAFAGDGGPAVAASLEQPARPLPRWRRRSLFRRHRQQPHSPPRARPRGARPGHPVVPHHRGQRHQPARGSRRARRDRRHLRHGTRTGRRRDRRLGCHRHAPRHARRSRGALRRHARAPLLRAGRAGQRAGAVHRRGQRDGQPWKSVTRGNSWGRRPFRSRLPRPRCSPSPPIPMARPTHHPPPPRDPTG